MIKINVRCDMNSLIRDLNRIQRDVIPKVAARALNRAIDGVRAEAVRTLAGLTAIKQKDIRSRMYVKGATPNNLVAELGVLPYAPNLSKFRATKGRGGITANAWNQRKTYRGTFALPSGQVVSRRGKRKEPVKPIYGPSLPNTFMRKPVLDRLEAVARQRWRSEFEREMARRLLAQ